MLGVVVLAMVVETAVRTNLPGRWVSLAVGLAIAPLLLVRRTSPLTALAIPFGLGTIHSIAQLATGTELATLDTFAWVLLFVYSLVRWGSGREVMIGLGLVVVGTAASLAVTGLSGGSGLGGDDQVAVRLGEDLLGAVVVMGGIVELAFAVRRAADNRRRELVDVLAAERRELARELHDTVAHHVSAIAVQAQAGRAVADTDPAAAIAVLGRVEEEASRALAEMRGLVRVLRDDGDRTRSPQPGLEQITALADDDRRPPVTVEVDAAAGELDAPLPATLFRLAQEAVTNARRHARGATGVAVRVSGDHRSVRLRVTDDGAGVGQASTNGGYGLVGMAERARLVGGSCTAGPRAEGGWAVDAVLPRDGGAG